MSWFRWLIGPSDVEREALRVRRLQAASERDLRERAACLQAASERDLRERAACEICSGRAVYRCPICRAVITLHSHENDFVCKTHEFVNPIRDSDGARIDGDGDIGPVRALQPEPEPAA